MTDIHEAIKRPTEARDLLTRLEQATEGSRELDEAIHRELGIPLQSAGGAYAAAAHTMKSLRPQPYTTSLDAALTLVPEGYYTDNAGAQVDGIHGGNLRIKWVWSLYNYDPICKEITGSSRWVGEAPTPALALCIAAVRARG